MSTTGLDVFDKTIQTTNIWLDEIMQRIGPDRNLAWHILGAVLRALRDRLPIDEGAHLAAQLPILVRGLYYDQWHPAAGIRKDRTQEEFFEHVAEGLQGVRPVNVRDAVRAVFSVLDCHLSRGQVDKVATSLPKDIRVLWPSAGDAESTEAGASGAGGSISEIKKPESAQV
jgi:uncharacterized protein (DUF2267 family)